MTVYCVDSPEEAFTLIFKSAPEHRERLEKFRKEHVVFFERVAGKPGIALKATKEGRVQFACKDLQVMWLLGFSLWKSIELFSPAVLLSGLTKEPLSSVLALDDKLKDLERDYRERMAAVMTLLSANKLDCKRWPDDIPLPVKSCEDWTDKQNIAAFDLVMMAISVLFLHELKHVEFFAEPDTGILRAKEELQCDAWARDWFISELADYARESGDSHQKVYSKRAMALLLVSEFLRLDDEYSQRKGVFNDVYPPLAQRIVALSGAINLPGSDKFWIFSACILLAETRRQRKKLPPLDGMSPRKIAESLINVLHHNA